MQTFKRILASSFFSFILLSMIGLGLGAIVGTGRAYLRRRGAFESWEKLGGPVSFLRIAEAMPHTVLAQTGDGSLYYWTTANCEPQVDCSRWVALKDASKKIAETDDSSQISSSSCKGLSERFTFQKEPPGKVAQCVFTKFDDRVYPEENYYAVLTDGTIWVWRYNAIVDLFDKLNVLASAFIGLMISWVIFFILRMRKKDGTQRKLLLTRSAKVVLNILMVIIFSLIGIVAGYKIGNRIENPPPPPTYWEILDGGQLKFSEIIDLNNNGILARAADGNSYLYFHNKWTQADNLPPNGTHSEPIKKSKTCAEGKLELEPPGNVMECVSKLEPSGPGAVMRYYALFDDGTIWTWAPVLTGTDTPILSVFICPSIGLVLGVLISLILIILQYNKKQQSTSIME